MTGLALTAALVALWCLTHRYKGVSGDAELYAVQALAHIEPNLRQDVFLNGVSQDQYTIFSPAYAALIKILGLHTSAVYTLVFCKLCFFSASWALARTLTNNRTAFFTTALLIILPGDYGAYHIFRFSEDLLTARSLAEVLSLLGVLAYFNQRKILAIFLTVSAFAVHPIMALPGVLLLVCLSSSRLVAVTGALAMVLTALCIALSAQADPTPFKFLRSLDPAWLEIVRERSQFLFLQTWSLDDWLTTARPFVGLLVGAYVLTETRLRKFCDSALLIGATGLTIALIAGAIGPDALLLQGQAWRWTWITMFVGISLIAPTTRALWLLPKCGQLAALLFVASWTLSSLNAPLCMILVLLLISARRLISKEASRYARFAALALGLIVAIWIVANCWTIVRSPLPESGREAAWLQWARNIAGVEGVAPLAAAAFAGFFFAARRVVATSIFTTLLLIGIAFGIPGTFIDLSRYGTPEEIDAFAGWRKLIAPEKNVFVVSAQNSAAFAWFSLQRPSYLTVNQSSGVVFSRDTALEIRRRAQVLLPIEDPGWRLSSAIEANRGRAPHPAAVPRRFTLVMLEAICEDPVLGFVVAREDVAPPAGKHAAMDEWKDWNLYDCNAFHKHVS